MTAAGRASRVEAEPNGNRTEDRTVTAAGSYNATATQNGTQWVMHMAAFRADGWDDATKRHRPG